MLKLKMTGKSFSPGILKLLHIRFVENGFNLWYNYLNVNLICGYFFTKSLLVLKIRKAKMELGYKTRPFDETIYDEVEWLRREKRIN